MIQTGGSASTTPTSELIDPFVLQAARAPLAGAICAAAGEVGYGALQSAMLRCAAGLAELGIQPGDVVALAAERSAATVALILAIVANGAAYLPLDAQQPDERLAGMIADARPRLVIVAPELLQRLPAGCIWTEPSALLSGRGEFLPRSSGPLAYVLFTSGSTGRPKGVAMRTAAVAGLLDWHRSHPRLARPARTLQFAPLGFDVSFQEIFSTLHGGGTLVLPTDAQRRDPWKLLALLERERVERVFLPFVALQAVAEAALGERRAFAALRDVITAGEQLRVTPAIRAFFSALPGAVLHNHYGPTETHVVTAHELRGDAAHWPDFPPIGMPLPHARVQIEDADHDGAGELLLGGACLADGYVNQSGLTAQRFVAIDGQRWYRTGDRVRRNATGVLEYLGRLDDQIKVAGVRIEPADIEAVLSRHPAVAGAAVVAQPRPGGGTLLAAHVVAREAFAESELRDELGKYCSSVLPEYMQPQAFMFHAVLPASTNGKVDRQALARQPAAAELAWNGDAPLEQQLVELWRQLLGVSAIDAASNIFECGARSLTVVHALTELRRHGHVMSVTQIYDNPTLSAQAAVLRAKAAGTRSVPDPGRAARLRAALSRFAKPNVA
jgi:amino acid adenylation domain-containing protein